jgi:hypothetical protein
VGFEPWPTGNAVRIGRSRAAEPASGPSDRPESTLRREAADLIERVARRVRAGELPTLVLRPGLTEAGALAAALAAILAPAPRA